MKVGGRLSRAIMQVEAKQPVNLPNIAHVSQLIINHAHQEVGHPVGTMYFHFLGNGIGSFEAMLP